MMDLGVLKGRLWAQIPHLRRSTEQCLRVTLALFIGVCFPDFKLFDEFFLAIF